jgi:hypothetical protein
MRALEETYLTYTTTLAFYFHLAALPAETRPNLQTHPVLQRLLQLKEALSQMENLDFAGDADDESDPDEFAAGFEGESFLDGSDEDDDNVDDDDDEDEDELLALGGPMDGKRDAAAERAWRQQMLEGLEEGELEELMAEMARMQRGEAGPMDDDDEMSDELPAPVKPAKKSKAKAAEGKQVKKATTPAAPAFPTIDEPTPSFSSTSSKPRKAAKASSSKLLAGDDEDALAEPTTLSAPDSSAKDAAKHSLRFHTSKIESAASRRASARSGRMGGDDDVPYRNKQAGRDAALRKNSGAGAGANGDGDDLDGEEWGEADRAAAKAVRDMDGGLDLVDDDGDDDGGDAGEGDDGYYQLVKKRKREEKEDKQAAYDEAREEERCVSLSDHAADRSTETDLLHLFQVCRGRVGDRPALAHAGDPQEQGPHALALQGGPQPPRQEAHALRQGQEAGRVQAGRLHGRPERPQGFVRRRGDRYLAGRQESKVLRVLHRDHHEYQSTKRRARLAPTRKTRIMSVLLLARSFALRSCSLPALTSATPWPASSSSRSDTSDCCISDWFRSDWSVEIWASASCVLRI